METLAPSVRRSLRPALALILIVTGLPASVVAVGSLHVVARTALRSLHASRWALDGMLLTPGRAIVVAAGAVAELAWTTRRHPRPWAVNRQVPQGWGHEQGPWKAAARYGVRLGVGPATILTSWTWWAGALLAATTGWADVVWFSVIFVVARAVVTVWLPGDPSDGVQLARRMATVRRFERTAMVGSIVGAVLSCVLVAGPWT